MSNIICISVELRDPPLYEDIIITNDVLEVQATKDEFDKGDGRLVTDGRHTNKQICLFVACRSR